jgi:hypothetical protein
MNCYCTIITANYFFYAKALFDSIKKYDSNLNFQVLVVGDFEEDLIYNGIEVIKLDLLKSCFQQDYNSIKHYEVDEASKLRWALKPLFLKYLLLKRKFDKALFLDPDLYFYSNPLFLFDDLNDKDVIITPHWRSKDPVLDPDNFNWLFTGGLFNAGFFGCNANSINILDWWLKACSYKMEKADGFYVDQVYLNLMPIYFSGQVEILQHKGCNVATWNIIECERSIVGNAVLINKEYPIVFIHYTNGTINLINNGTDALLKPYLKEYKHALLKHNKKFNFPVFAVDSGHRETFKSRWKARIKRKWKRIIKSIGNE